MKSVAVVGGGSWGTALACLIARTIGHTYLYTPEEQIVDEINHKHSNSKYLGDTKVHAKVVATAKIKDIITADSIIIAVPSHAFSQILLQLKQAGMMANTLMLIATKGLCENPVQLFSSYIESKFDNPYAFISGPNFAKEVAEDKFTSITISSKDIALAKKVANRLASKKLETSVSNDIITVQVAAIVKNIVAIRSGMMQADTAGENALAWLISKGLEEIAIIAKALGGKPESLTLPAVIGDLVLTCYSKTSRNTKFGCEFHQNNYSKEFLNNYPTLVEGVNSARLLKIFLKGYRLDLPIISSVADLV